MALQKDLAREYVELFHDLPSLTIARLLFHDAPEVYPTVDAARSSVRKIRGAIGQTARDVAVQNGEDGLFRDPQSPHNPIPSLPEPIRSIEDNPHVVIDAERALVIADTQMPFHDNRAIELALRYGEERNADCIILNGDILDFHKLSRFVQDPREKDFRSDLDMVNQFIRHIRGRFPEARIIFKDGNHEERYDAYMFVKAPELLMISEKFEFKNVVGLAANGVEHVRKTHHIKLGRLNIVHGHEWGGSGGGGVNPARWLYLRAQATAICGHFHRTSSHSETDMDGSTTSTWSTGCLCNLTPAWLRYNKWNQGFAFIESDGRNFRVDNLKIIEGAVY